MKITPVTFEEDSKFYDRLAEKYLKHNTGLFILAPSGAGKTYFCKQQKQQDWIDGDELWMGAKAHPDGPWWNEAVPVINRIDKRSDVITSESKELGFWIMGASNFWLKPDAVVIPDWETHVGYIKHRQESDYDGGATLEALDQVKSHIEVIMKWHTDYGVPRYYSIDEAVKQLTKQAN